MEDASLMKQIAGGDEAALQALLRRYGPLIRYILRPILPDQRDREECYADISLKIWQTAGSFDETKGTLKAWLTVLSRNSALNHARRRTEADAPLEEHMPHEAGSAEEADSTLYAPSRSSLATQAMNAGMSICTGQADTQGFFGQFRQRRASFTAIS